MITTNYERMDEQVVKWAVTQGLASNIVSIDLETKVVNGKFLDGETLLGISVTRRAKEVDTEVFILEEETGNSEMELLSKLDEYLRKTNPAIVIGFNHRGYDGVLLSLKKRGIMGPGLWEVKDMLERAYWLDVMHAARFAIANHDGGRPKILSLAKVIGHPMFANLPLKRTKGMITGDVDKGVQIYNLWKNDRPKFRAYAEGDSHDTLLIFEEIFKKALSGT